MPSGEMVLDQKRAVIPQRLGLDVEVDEIMEALSHGRAGTRAVGLGATKNSKSHCFLAHREPEPPSYRQNDRTRKRQNRGSPIASHARHPAASMIAIQL
jgi:hypothetical protein